MKKTKFVICGFCMCFILIIGGFLIASKIEINKTNRLNKTNMGYSRKSTKRVRLSVCMPQNGWAAEALDPVLVNSVKKAIEASNNIKIELIAPDSDNYNESLDAMLSHGNMPDIYLIHKAMNKLQLYTAEGYTRDITELVEKDHNIKKVINKKYIDYMKVNGRIYGLPRYKPMSKVLWIRKDIALKYGISLSCTPTTEEFLQVMKKMVNKNIIPFSFPKFLDNLPFFYNAFNACGGIGRDDKGMYYDGFNTPETKQALVYMKNLYSMGIWDKEFSTNENNVIREKLISGKAFSNIDYFNRYIYYISEGKSKNSSFDLQPIYMLKGPKGGTGNLNEAIQDAFVVSPKCKNPKAAVALLSWMTTSEEYAKISLSGIKGKYYTVENGVIKPTEAAKASGYKPTATNFIMTHRKVKDIGFKWDPITEKYLPKQEKIAKENSDYLGPNIVIPGKVSNIYDKNAAAYKEKVESLAYKIITGADSIENCYAEYEKFWNSINGKKMLEELNRGKKVLMPKK